MAEKYVFGIDLGTTYSCIAYVDSTGRPVVAQNSEGKSITPSVIQIQDDGGVVVGEVAKESAVVEDDSTVEFAKRHMGEPGFVFSIKGNNYTPEEISSYILKKIAKDVQESSLGMEVKDVVITCPAYFGVAERLATQNAGIIAGLNVMEIIKEPLAAAFHFGVTAADENKNYMVFDLGGGTFDVTIMKIGDGNIAEVCSEGDHRLGGKDWDDKLINYLKSEFNSQVGIDVDFSADEDQSLRQAAEDAKKRLSSKAETQVRISAGGSSEAVVVSRETFDEITESLLERTFDITDAAIEVARSKGVEVDEILLVGGSTKMPQIKDAIISKYGKEPKSHEPDEAVAKGAAIYAVNVYINNQQKIDDWKDQGASEEDKPVVANAESYEEELSVDPLMISGSSAPMTATTAATKSYGIAIVSRTDSTKQEIKNMILKNTAMPDGRINMSGTFGTAVQNQSSVSIKIFESDYLDDFFDYDEDFLIGSAEMELPPNLPSGAPIEVTLTLDNQGLMKVHGKDLTGNNEVRSELQVAAALSEEQVMEMAERSKSIQIKDF
jgi:molecular chaperone DnaK (HSP70)